MATIIFDFDGTLHESLVIYAPAVHQSIRYLIDVEGIAANFPTDEDIAYWIGSAGIDVWDALVPGITPELKQICGSMVGQEMKRLTQSGEAKLYPFALEALGVLRDNGHTLIFLSNCKRDYMDTHAESFRLTEYFHGFYCAQDYGRQPKYRIFESIAVDFPVESDAAWQGYIIVGDRDKDIEIAQVHGLPFIGCTYGYGTLEELSEATLLCHTLEDLPALVEQLAS